MITPAVGILYSLCELIQIKFLLLSNLVLLEITLERGWDLANEFNPVHTLPVRMRLVSNTKQLHSLT